MRYVLAFSSPVCYLNLLHNSFTNVNDYGPKTPEDFKFANQERCKCIAHFASMLVNVLNHEHQCLCLHIGDSAVLNVVCIYKKLASDYGPFKTLSDNISQILECTFVYYY